LLDLEKDEFEIRDEGERQEILTFARGDVPFAAVVLLDTSLSMQGPRLVAAQAGARAFFSGMRGLDEGKLVLFADRSVVSTPFTSVSEVLLAGISGAVAGGGTTLNDQLYLALKLLERRQGRRVVIVLSDGLDANSVLSVSDVLLKARQSQALVYWIRLHQTSAKSSGKLGDLFSAWRDATWYHQQIKILEEVAVQSGGRVVMAEQAEIPQAFGEILRELREQYVLGYYPTVQHHDGRWRSVRVKVARDKVTVRAREGYLDL
jgi:VWFA-related protein